MSDLPKSVKVEIIKKSTKNRDSLLGIEGNLFVSEQIHFKLIIQILNPSFSCMSFPLEIPSNTKIE